MIAVQRIRASGSIVQSGGPALHDFVATIGFVVLVRTWTENTMNWNRSTLAWMHIALAIWLAGCSPTQPFFLHEDGDLSHYLDVATEIAYPDLDSTPIPDATEAHAPFTVENTGDEEPWELTLEEAISIAMQNAHVLRSLGGRVFTPVGQSAANPPESLTLNPDFSPSAYDVAIQETSNTGPEAALANFDAQLESQLTWDRTDRPRNVDSSLSSLFLQFTERDSMNYQTELSKRLATGGQMSFRNITQYESSNDPTRVLTSDWFTSLEMEMRHPLLRNSGVQVNRVPLMLARMNTDIAIADFEINVRNFVLEIEQAYWNLYFHYHNLDAARTGAANALQTWKQTQIRGESQIAGGEAANEAQARGQYFTFKSRLETAKSELLHQESRLRYLLGIAATDGRLIRPVDQPTKARVQFDWYEIRNEALIRSPELRRQRWRVKQQQLQLIAARNQLLPQFDAIALYRFLGFGNDLVQFGTRNGANFPDASSNAAANLTENDFGEWQLGFQYQMPIGFRAEMVQVRNTQLQLRRAEKRLEDQELSISHQLTHAIRRLRDSYRVAQTLFNTLKAYRDQVDASKAAFELAQTVPLDVVLDAQSRLAQSEIEYFRALTEYNLSIAEVHHRKGSLLEYNGIVLAEGPWPNKAYYDAHRRARQVDASYYLDYGYTRPAVVSRGSPPQLISKSSTVGQSAADEDAGSVMAVDFEASLFSGSSNTEDLNAAIMDALQPAASSGNTSVLKRTGDSTGTSPASSNTTSDSSDSIYGSLGI